MPLFHYEALDTKGQLTRGELEATTRAAAIDHLHGLGYRPLAAREKGTGFFHLSFPLPSQRLAFRDMAFLTQELATLLQAGLPLERALALLASYNTNKSIKTFLDAVLTKLRAGQSFAGALATQKALLPKAYIGLIHAGEAGGGKTLEETVERLAHYLTGAQKTREAVVSALIYPAILLIVATLAIALMLIVVLPQFEPLFESAGVALPFSTQLVMGMSHILRDYWFVLLVLIAVLAWGARQALKNPARQMKLDHFVLRLPRLGEILARAEAAQFCHTLSALQGAGLSLSVALPIAGESFSNRYLAAALERVTARVREGQLLSTALTAEPIFPPLMAQLVRIGEETGKLDALLARAADIQSRDVQRAMERLMTLLAPLLTIVIGLVIAGIVAAVLSAILSVNDLAG
jgi:general secretion pathway protein F